MKRTRSVSTEPLLTALALTLAGVGLAYWTIGMPPLLGAEDAAIGFRYARNLALGDGIVYNPAGEHVEGFTSFLWLLVSAGVYRLFGAAGLEAALLGLSLFLTVFTLAVVVRLLRDHLPAGVGRWTAGAWLCAQAGFFFWSGISLMDVALWAAALTAYLAVLVSRLEGRSLPSGSLALVAVALVLTRPESLLVVPATLVPAAFAYGLPKQMRRIAAVVIGTWAASAAVLTAFRLWYFGHPLPNTYYAKVSPDVVFRLGEGLHYLGEYFSAHPLALAPLLTVIGLLGARVVALLRPSTEAEEPPAARAATLAAGMIVVGFVSVVYGGGDHYQGHRFLQPYLPMAALPLGAGVYALVEWTRRRSATGARAATAAVMLLVVAPLYGEWRSFSGHEIRRQAIDVGMQGRFVGHTLDGVFADTERPELGLWMVGGAGYAYTGPVKDLLGLNWVAMGMSPGDRTGPRDHAAFNTDVFWSAPPELMIPEPEAVLRAIRCVSTVLGGAMDGLLTTARFRASFEPVRIRRDGSEPIIAYARSDWIGRAPGFVEPLGWSYCDGG